MFYNNQGTDNRTLLEIILHFISNLNAESTIKYSYFLFELKIICKMMYFYTLLKVYL